MIVADTDVLIDTLYGKQPASRRVSEVLRQRHLATTTITVFELFSGARDEQHRTRLKKLLRPMTILPLEPPAAKAAAQIRRTLESSGWKISLPDYLIAGICLTSSAPLMTRNRRHFDRIPGLLLDDFAQGIIP